MSPYDETVRLTKLIFDAIYAKEFANRETLDKFVQELIKKNKQSAEYTYISLYFNNTFTIHVYVVCEQPEGYKSCSTLTLSFCMIWNTDGDGRLCKDRFNQCNMDNIATYIGTPGYWFGRTENSSVGGMVVDERRTNL